MSGKKGGKKGGKEGGDGKLLSKKELRRRAKASSGDEGPAAEAGGPTVAGARNQLVKMFEKNHGWPEYVWLKGTAYDSTAGGQKKRNMNMNIQIPNFDLHIGKGQVLLTNAELNIQYGTRYGIIGRNGIGKSVLLRAISSREGPFEAIPSWYSILHVAQEIVGDERSPLEIVLASDKERHWLLKEVARLEAEDKEKAEKGLEEAADAVEEAEMLDENGEEDFLHYGLKDLYERLREIDAHKAEARAASILAGLQFDAVELRSKPSNEYSGGWRMRIALAQALFMAPELLILDEPTNHLDLHASIWLEHYLSRYKKTLLLVSHDESILNDCVDSVLHFFDQKLTRYKGNYSSFLTTREQNITAAKKKQKAQDVKIKKDRKAAQKNAGSKEGARKRKEVEKVKQDRIEITLDEKAPSFNFPEIVINQETAVLKFDNVSYSYVEGRPVVKDLQFGIYMDSRIALVGANGTGKSTIMKLMSGELRPDFGSVEGNSQLRVVKYDQHAEEKLDLDATAIEWLQRSVKDFEGGEPAARKFLGRFGLTGQLPLQKVGTLSGGQKARLVFATLAAQGPHLMLLDEPTNHLDLFAIQSLAEGLQAYGGGLVVISHNQSILSAVCNQCWVVTDHSVKMFEGGFSEYKQSIVDVLLAEEEE